MTRTDHTHSLNRAALPAAPTATAHPAVAPSGATGRRLAQLAAKPEAPPAETLAVSKIAQDVFISRSYTLNSPAQIGQGLAGTIGAAAAVASDLEGLAQPNLPMASKLALAGKLVRDGAGIVTSGHRTVRGLQLAHESLIGVSSIYAKGAQTVGDKLNGRLLQAANPTAATPLLDRLKGASAVSGIGLAVISLPSLTQAAAVSTTKAVRTLRDPGASDKERLTAVRGAAYTDAALIFTAAAIPSSIRTLSEVGKAQGFLRTQSTRLVETRGFQRAEAASKMAMPVADATLLVADGINLYQTLKDPHATQSSKVRATLNVGLDVTKMTMYALPQSRGVRVAYTAASVAQLGLAVHGLIVGKD